ncbi:MAG: arginase family protein, partial [Gemmatimonadota bacterium]
RDAIRMDWAKAGSDEWRLASSDLEGAAAIQQTNQGYIASISVTEKQFDLELLDEREFFEKREEALEFLRERDAGVTWREELPGALTRVVAGLAGPAMVSFDLDAVDRAHAPGVSAPATDGLRPGTWLEAAERVGRSAAVTSVDLVECNPRFDQDGRTASLAAATVWRFLRGRARATLDGQSGSAT